MAKKFLAVGVANFLWGGWKKIRGWVQKCLGLGDK